MIETGLLEKLIDRAVEARMAEMRGALWVHHWLLTEVLRQMPREAVQQVAQLMDQERVQMSEAEKASVANCQCRTEDVPNGALKVYQSRLNKRAIVALDSSLFNPYFNARQNWGDGRSAA